jgi:hypothetical protein
LIMNPQVGASNSHHGPDATAGGRRPSSPDVLS